jgi:phosphoglucosamine mutase
MRTLFGTDGIRGLANQYPITVEIAMGLGRALASNVKDMRADHRIVIGKDTRISGYMLENALVAGICSMGVNALLVGPLPTPAIAFVTTSMRADAGIVISASHNPFQDNGIKIFSRDGFKLPDLREEQIEQAILNTDLKQNLPVADKIGRAYRIDDAQGRYIEFVKHSFPQEHTLDGFHIVLDCAHGATYKVAPKVFEELGAEVTRLGVDPSGVNINKECGALYPELMANKVKEVGADIGIALDGDGDRLIVSDENGEIVNGDHIMAIGADYLFKKGKLKKNTLVTTVMSNLGLELAMQSKGINMVRTKVGDRYVVEEMRKNGFSFGGEQSGHLIFIDHITTGDGILAALQMLAVMKEWGKPISELAQVMESFPQVLKNVKTTEKIAPEAIPGLPEQVKAMEDKLGNDGRILIRPSGTEPLIRVMVEGMDDALIDIMADELSETILRTQG